MTTKAQTPICRQEGTVLILVLALVIILSGLGLLAVQHTRYELRSATNYYDGIQAARVAESSQIISAFYLSEAYDQFYGALLDLQTNPGPGVGECPPGSLRITDQISGLNLFDSVPDAGSVDAGVASVFKGMNVTPGTEVCVMQPVEVGVPAGYGASDPNSGLTFKLFEVVSVGSFGETRPSGPNPRYLRAQGKVASTVMVGPVPQ